MISFLLEGKTVMVTGAGRGIGQACALRMAEAGATIVAVSRTATEVAELAEMVNARSGKASAEVCDVTDREQVAELFQRVGPIDVVLNNAGTNVPEPFLEVGTSLELLLDVNVKGTFLVSQAAARGMVAGGRPGVILNMTSQLGHVGFPGRSVYTLTKHAIEGLTKAMALELAPHGIRVNAIAPTFIETPMTKPFLSAPGFRDEMLRRIPLGRLGGVDDVAAAAIFLASPAASMITGTSLKVDGGWTAQ
jgi:NAD(P)-dependent dehydrogenase (short-subunit alcohol dehydrogenase family)